MRLRIVIPIAALALALAGGAQAQQSMPSMQMGSQPGAADAPSTPAFKAANDKMMRDMAVPLTGKTDHDFVASMIPHHQGAIDMAEIELKYGSDPQLKRMAHDIIAAQKKEIATMQAWLAKHP